MVIWYNPSFNSPEFEGIKNQIAIQQMHVLQENAK